MQKKGFISQFNDVWLLDGMRMPMVDYCGALGHVSPTDLGMKAARAMLAKAGVPKEVPAIMVQRICGTGFELFRQAGEQIQSGAAEVALLVGSESVTRNPIAAFDHRSGFKLGAPVGFKDFMWEALKDSAPGINMIQTAENLAKKYGITRAEVDAFASNSFAKAVAAQEQGFHAGEIAPVITEKFELERYAPRGIRLQGELAEVALDTHPRTSPIEVLAKLRPVYEGGVQTGGNSAALVDAAYRQPAQGAGRALRCCLKIRIMASHSEVKMARIPTNTGASSYLNNSKKITAMVSVKEPS